MIIFSSSLPASSTIWNFTLNKSHFHSKILSPFLAFSTTLFFAYYGISTSVSVILLYILLHMELTTMEWLHILDVKSIGNNVLFNSAHNLLQVLYRRDSRRSFCPEDHWLIKEVKVSSFLKEIDAGKRIPQILLQKIPHMIAHKDRVILLRKWFVYTYCFTIHVLCRFIMAMFYA